MAVNPLTPGVYIDEISVFPPSVAPVATAVPAFIGYTEKAIINGTQWNYSTNGVTPPVRITSMLDYEQIFGGAYPELFTANVSNSGTAVVATTLTTLSQFTLHYNLRMYFANGGGPCYVVSVDDYFSAPNTPNTISSAKLIDGVNITEKADEVTLLVVPEAVASSISSAQRALIHSAQLDLCNKMKDRFALMDVVTTVPAGVGTISSDSSSFRTNEVGNNNLKYGASYYPALDTTLTRYYLESTVKINDTRTPVVGVTFGTTRFLTDVFSGVVATGTITITSFADLLEVAPDTIEVAGIVFTAQAGTVTPGTLFFQAATDNNTTATSLTAQINSHAAASLLVTASQTGAVITVTSKSTGNAVNSYTLAYDDNGSLPGATVSGTTLTGGISADLTLYNNIVSLLTSGYPMRLYPSSSMAGIYASVDRDRGVWKAPANVSLTGVIAPSVNISAADQENLNVDAGSGKSINAIRAFAGKGILVWGGRTLAGNDNEWRYINVRRLFIFAEESIQKACESMVFEPNDANTWSRVRGLISSFLTNLWRDGALAGATPEQAYFVRVGLGVTMTAQDVLEGKMIVEVGLAAVRPAEFIILKFSHKLQEA